MRCVDDTEWWVDTCSTRVCVEEHFDCKYSTTIAFFVWYPFFEDTPVYLEQGIYTRVSSLLRTGVGWRSVVFLRWR